MKEQQNKPDDNKGAGPVSHVANGNVGDRGVLNDKTSDTAEGNADQRQNADYGLQNGGNDEEDQFDINSLKGDTSGGQQQKGDKPGTDHEASAS